MRLYGVSCKETLSLQKDYNLCEYSIVVLTQDRFKSFQMEDTN